MVLDKFLLVSWIKIGEFFHFLKKIIPLLILHLLYIRKWIRKVDFGLKKTKKKWKILFHYFSLII